MDHRDDNHIPETEIFTPIGRLSERIARRELFRRSGKWAIALTVGGWLAGTRAPVALAVESPLCSSYANCACSSEVCWYQGSTQCPKRYADDHCNSLPCQNSSSHIYCWNYTNGSGWPCTACDYYCSGSCNTSTCSGCVNNCHCYKCTKPGTPQKVTV